MFRTPLIAMILMALSTTVFAEQCDYTPQSSAFKMGFTGYGFPDKSYDVKDNTFTDYRIQNDNGKLLHASITINSHSIDTSADKRNWYRSGNWPEPTIQMRNQNIVNGLFSQFVDDSTITASITAIDDNNITLSITMNGVTQTTTLSYEIADGVLNAKGSIDIADYHTEKALKHFAAICSNVWHRGKTWTDVDIYFTVPVAESRCD